MSAKRNLLIYLKKKSISKAEFYKKTGVSNGFLDKSDHISTSNLEIILNYYEDLSSDWLITGKGNMLKNMPISDKYIVQEPVADYNKLNSCALCKEKDERIKDLQGMISMQKETISSLLQQIEPIQKHQEGAEEVISTRTG